MEICGIALVVLALVAIITVLSIVALLGAEISSVNYYTFLYNRPSKSPPKIILLLLCGCIGGLVLFFFLC